MTGRVSSRWRAPRLALLLVALLLLAVPGPATAQTEHTVVAGDTLYDLAATYGTSVTAIQAANDMNDSTIRIGDVLTIPVDLEPPGFRLHVSVSGESLELLASRFELPLDTLASANPGLAPGDDLAARVVLVPPEAGVTVWVAAGETVIDLAARHGVGPAALASANGLAPGALLEPGQPLLVPIAPVTGAGAGTAMGVGGGGPEANAGPAADTREHHRRLQRELLARAWEHADAIERPSETFLYPLEGRLSSAFGWRNISVAGNRYHGGIDLAAPAGTPIAAARDGNVARVGWIGAYGYAVYLDHGDGSQTRYAHMQTVAVEAGDTVRQGDIVGFVGSSGASTGPHLHFELRFAGRAVDPLLYLERAP